MEKEETLIRTWRLFRGRPDLLAAFPKPERITLALATGDYRLLPEECRDPLVAYRRHLSDRQRAIVNRHRGL